MIRVRKILLSFALLASFLPAFGQEMFRISGYIRDDSTGECLPYAQVSLKNSGIGTSSNMDGFYSLAWPDYLKNDSVRFSSMGYQPVDLSLTELEKDTAVSVRLKNVGITLRELEITSFSPEEVIRRAVAAIPKNYGTDSVLLTAFVRSSKYAGNRLAEFSEAMIGDLKTGYDLYPAKMMQKRQRNSNIPLLIRGRVISDTALVNGFGEIGRSAGCLGCNFVHDFAEFYHETVLDEEFFRYYQFSMEELITPGGKIYHIRFDQRKGVKKLLWRGELYIRADDFALLKITQRPSFNAYDTYEREKYRHTYYILDQPGWIKEMPLMEHTVTYDKRGEYYCLGTIRIENWLTFVHPGSGRMAKFSHRNEVVVTDVSRDPAEVKGFRGDKNIGVNQRWDQVVGAGDDSFWKGFNYLPVEEKLKESLKSFAGQK